MLIAISGFPRSGSTFLYTFIIKLLKIKEKNCLGNFDAPINGCSNNKYINNFIKTESLKIAKIIPSEEFYDNKKVKTIFIERNFLDVASSAKQRWSGNWEKGYTVLNWFKEDYLPRYKSLSSFRNDNRVLWLNYEECFVNKQIMADKICDFLQIKKIKISEEFLESLLNENLRLSNNFWLIISRLLRRRSVKATSFIKSFLPSKYKQRRWYIWRRLNFIFPKHSKKNLVGPGHVSSYKGEPGTFIKRLTSKEIKKLKELYRLEFENKK